MCRRGGGGGGGGGCIVTQYLHLGHRGWKDWEDRHAGVTKDVYPGQHETSRKGGKQLKYCNEMDKLNGHLVTVFHM